VLKLLVPVQQRKVVFDAVHGLAHPGARATRWLLTAHYVRRGCAVDVTAWCRECVHCAVCT
jgi:hypothetical protein